MNQLQKEIYNLMPDDMLIVQAIETSEKIERLIINKVDELKAALTEIRIAEPSDQRVVNLALISLDEVFKPLNF